MMKVMDSGEIWNALYGMKPVLLMVGVQFAFAGLNVLYKLAANDGMSLRVIIAYRFIFASVFLIPFALFFERKSRPKLTRVVLFQAFMCGLFGGSVTQNLYIEGLALTSATFVSAITQLNPAITFILAISIRLERLNLGSLAGKGKVLGTVMGIGGAMLLTFYKGVDIDLWSTHVDLLHKSQQPNNHLASPHPESANRLLGFLLALGSGVCYTLWLLIQSKMSERYPCYYSSTALMSTMGSIQAVSFALCMERDWSQWKLGWNIRLLTVAYSGIVATAVSASCISLCLRMRGPLFVSAFNPLMLLLIALAGSLVLDEKLHLGSVLGAVLIVFGLYAVLWGKGKEMEKMTQSVPSASFPESGTAEVVIMPPDDKSNNTNVRVKNNAPNSLST